MADRPVEGILIMGGDYWPLSPPGEGIPMSNHAKSFQTQNRQVRTLSRFVIFAFIPGLCGMPAVCAGPGIAIQRAAASYARIPLGFQPNQGQVDPAVQYVSRGQGYSLFLTPGEAYVTLDRQAAALDQ